jgi:predicted molibdopterin-dependent oxidoreductase YjgC
VVQDIVSNRTADIAHVILPGAAVFEKHGSFTNMEGRIQTFEPAVMPPGDAKADWEILAHLAKVMGYPEQYEKIEKIRQEIRRTVPMYQGLGNHQQDWIRNSESDNPFLNDQAKFQFLPAKQAMPVSTDPSFPLFAKIRSPRFHLGSGTRTSRSARIKAYNGQGPVELSPADFKGLGLADDEQVRIASAAGALDRRLKQNRHLNPGQVIIPSGVNGNDAMFLAPLAGKEDPVTFGSSFSRVRIEKISEN